MYVNEREREMIKKKKKKKKKVTLTGIVSRSLLVEAEEGVAGGVGEVEGGRPSTSDDDEDNGSREGSGGDGSGDETRGGE